MKGFYNLYDKIKWDISNNGIMTPIELSVLFYTA